MIADVYRKAQMAGVGLYSVDAFYTKPPRRTGRSFPQRLWPALTPGWTMTAPNSATMPSENG
jgi:hypothetical protein